LVAILQPVRTTAAGPRGRKDDPLYRARRTLHTGADLLTDKRKDRLTNLFAADEHVEVEASWGIYQRMISAYREPDRAKGRGLMKKLIDSVSHDVPTALSEVITLGRTLTKRAADVPAYFDRPGTSNGPTDRAPAKLICLLHDHGEVPALRRCGGLVDRAQMLVGVPGHGYLEPRVAGDQARVQLVGLLVGQVLSPTAPTDRRATGPQSLPAEVDGTGAVGTWTASRHTSSVG